LTLGSGGPAGDDEGGEEAGCRDHGGGEPGARWCCSVVLLGEPRTDQHCEQRRCRRGDEDARETARELPRGRGRDDHQRIHEQHAGVREVEHHEDGEREQLEEVDAPYSDAGGPAESPRTPGRRRSAARAEATYGQLLSRLHPRTELETVEEAETVLQVILESVVRRLTLHEADDLFAQRPSLLQPARHELPQGPDRSVTRQAIERKMARRLEVEPERAKRLVDAVGATMAESLSVEEIEDVRSQLPEDLRTIFSDFPEASGTQRQSSVQLEPRRHRPGRVREEERPISDHDQYDRGGEPPA
jgi:uncharacterized protein (DUF2267 family)